MLHVRGYDLPGLNFAPEGGGAGAVPAKGEAKVGVLSLVRKVWLLFMRAVVGAGVVGRRTAT
jgi:hypothetical protein